jgi:type I restriction enzyme S subunit
LDVGSLALKMDHKISLVSPLYECFTTEENLQYMLEWFKSSEFKYAIKSRFEGGVRNTLTFTNLATIEINIPEKDTQNKYAAIFTSFNKKIKYEEDRLLLLVEFKKGIMQKMFV